MLFNTCNKVKNKKCFHLNCSNSSNILYKSCLRMVLMADTDNLSETKSTYSSISIGFCVSFRILNGNLFWPNIFLPNDFYILCESISCVSLQQLESLAWHQKGSEFMSAHADGSYIIWSKDDATKPKEQATTPYGKSPHPRSKPPHHTVSHPTQTPPKEQATTPYGKSPHPNPTQRANHHTIW